MHLRNTFALNAISGMFKYLFVIVYCLVVAARKKTNFNTNSD